MTEHGARSDRGFGKRKEPHRVIIARGETVRSFNISPWFAGLATGVGLLFAVGYIGATAYLVLRDDIIQSSAERQAQMQLSYEDRIAQLRAKVDRLTSRRVLEAQSIEERLTAVLSRQQDLDSRQSRVASLIEKAAKTGIRVAIGNPMPQSKPDRPEGLLAFDAGTDTGDTGIGGMPEPIDLMPDLQLRGSQGAQPPATPVNALTAPSTATAEDKRASLIEDVSGSLARMDKEANLALDVIAMSAERDHAAIVGAADRLGLRLAGMPDRTATEGTGGPFVAMTAESGFDARFERAERALLALEKVKQAARGIPVRSPIAGAPVSSSFGPRLDPFMGRMAMHTGTDFKATRGTPIQAPGMGKVVFAGRNGGYGKSVEIEHPSGVISRFAHMSRIAVTKGQTVSARDTIGYVGSTGRSTGPHLHYEIRIGDKPLNPARFLTAGETITPIIEN